MLLCDFLSDKDQQKKPMLSLQKLDLPGKINWLHTDEVRLTNYNMKIWLHSAHIDLSQQEKNAGSS